MGAFVSTPPSLVTIPVPITQGGTGTVSFDPKVVVRYNTVTNRLENGGNLTIGTAALTGGTATIVTNDNYCAIGCFTNTAGIAINLPAASGNAGRIIFVNDADGSTGGNTIVITPNGAETINGAPNYTINAAYGSVMLMCLPNSTTTFSWTVIAHD